MPVVKHEVLAAIVPWMQAVYSPVTAGPDPGWILSTSALAGATLLAIVGGLFAAQQIELVSEQHAADARLRDARQAYDGAAQNLSKVTHELRVAATRALLHDRQLATLVAVRGTVSAQEAERCIGTNELLILLSSEDRYESITGAVDKLTHVRKRALSALVCSVPVTDPAESWDQVRWNHFSIPLEEEEEWRAVYNVIAGQRAIEAKELANMDDDAGWSVAVPPPARRQAGSGLSDGDGAPPKLTDETANAMEMLTVRARAAEEKAAAGAALEAAELRRRELIPPAEFRRGVWVLIYLAVAVIFPLVMLAFGQRSLSFVIQYLVPAVLGLGVIALVIYFRYLSNIAQRPVDTLDEAELDHSGTLWRR